MRTIGDLRLSQLRLDQIPLSSEMKMAAGAALGLAALGIAVRSLPSAIRKGMMAYVKGLFVAKAVQVGTQMAESRTATRRNRPAAKPAASRNKKQLKRKAR